MFRWTKKQKIYDAGFAKGLMFGKAVGARDEQERIIDLLKNNASGEYRKVMLTPKLISLVKDQTKNITSEIFPDGSIYIAEVKKGKDD